MGFSRIRTAWIAAAGFAAVLAFGYGASAQQRNCQGETVPEKTVLDKTNIDALKTKCLDGYRIGDIIQERVEWQIRNQNLFLRLTSNKPLPLPYRRRMQTEKNKGLAHIAPPFDMAGWKGGVPFPDVKADDPQVAVKVIWNHVRGGALGDAWGTTGTNILEPNFVYALIEGDKGIERIQQWDFQRMWFAGRDDGKDMGDNDAYIKGLLFALTPQDVKGLGTFTIRYLTPKYDDTWAYIRSVRRVRRLSGGAWVDPIGGTDQLQDDIWFNAHPAWYQNYKLLGKRVNLWVADSKRDEPEQNRFGYNPAGKTLEEQFTKLVFKPPFWNFDDNWQPREQWVIDATPPDFHPYSKKIVYVDAENWSWGGGEAYDRKGEFWKALNFTIAAHSVSDGFIDPDTKKLEITQTLGVGAVVDFQRRHATTINLAPNFAWNPPSLRPEDLNLSNLEAAGR